MTKNEIFLKIKKIIVEQLSIHEDDINQESSDIIKFTSHDLCSALKKFEIW